MKIDNPLLAQVSTGAIQQSGGVAETRGGDGGTSNAGETDRVQLSNLSAALRDLPTEDPDRTAHLAAVAQALESGQYQIEADVLARNIVQELTSAS